MKYKYTFFSTGLKNNFETQEKFYNIIHTDKNFNTTKKITNNIFYVFTGKINNNFIYEISSFDKKLIAQNLSNTDNIIFKNINDYYFLKNKLNIDLQNRKIILFDYNKNDIKNLLQTL